MKKILLALTAGLLLAACTPQETEDAANNAANTVSDAASGAVSAVGDAASGAVDAAGDAVDAAGEAASDAVDAAGEAASDAVDAAGEAAGDAVDAVTGAADKYEGEITAFDGEAKTLTITVDGTDHTVMIDDGTTYEGAASDADSFFGEDRTGKTITVSGSDADGDLKATSINLSE